MPTVNINGEEIPVEITDTHAYNGNTWHTVKLLEDVQGCKAGDAVEGFYSTVNPETTKLYGITVSVTF